MLNTKDIANCTKHSHVQTSGVSGVTYMLHTHVDPVPAPARKDHDMIKHMFGA